MVAGANELPLRCRPVSVSSLPVLLSLMRGPVVHWEAPAGCPGEAELRGRLRERLVGRSELYAIRGRVVRVDDRTWRLQTTSRGVFGMSTRAPVEAAHCAELADDFVQYAEGTWSAWAEDPGAPRRPRGRVRVAGQGGYGLVPETGFGGGQLVFALAWRHARVELGVGADGVHRARLPGASERSDWVRGSLLLRGCGGGPLGSVELMLCGGVEGGLIRGRAEVWNPARPTLNLHVAPGLWWWFHRAVGLWVGASAGPLLPPLQPRGEDGESHGITRYFVAGGVGLEFRLDR